MLQIRTRSNGSKPQGIATFGPIFKFSLAENLESPACKMGYEVALLSVAEPATKPAAYFVDIKSGNISVTTYYFI